MNSPVDTWVAQQTGLFGNLNSETLRNWQIEKLKDLIKYASENTTFYQGKLNITDDITELPFTLPSDIARDPFAFLAIPQSEVARVTTLANSGTTRLKKRIFFSEADIERTLNFFAVGMSTMVSKGENAQILLSNRTENSLGSLLKKSLSRIGVSSEISGAIKSVSAAINESQYADCIIGMPDEIFFMCRTAPELRPKSVLLAADYIPQAVIEGIKETWKCKVFSHYGHTEFGFGCAVDCDYHSGLHTRDADLLFEIINPETNKPVNQGDGGEIVITTLSNEAMPLIRYRTGNISSIINTSCECGSIIPRIGRIEGRFESNIQIGDGDTLTIHQLDEIIFANPVVRGFNASLGIQENKKSLQLIVDAFDKIDLNSLIAKLPKNVKIEIKYDNADPFIKREKRRIHIS